MASEHGQGIEEFLVATALGWRRKSVVRRQEARTKNAREIARRGAELYDRLSAFVADLEKVGDRLRQAQDSFNDARDKLSKNKGNVIRQAEMLRSLGVKPTKALPAPLIEASNDRELDLEESEGTLT
jgi:DNA recombination protein RmuC